MADPTEGPLQIEPEKPLDPLLLDVLQELSNPGNILFTIRPGGHGALMSALGFSTQKIPAPWIKALVSKALIDQPVGRGNKVGCMGWLQYTITYEGQQVLNRRHR